MTHIWWELRGRTLWGCAALVALGMLSLWIEVARGASAIWGMVGAGGWFGFSASIVSMALLFFVVSVWGRRSYDRVASVTGSWRSGFDFFFCLDRPSLWFWATSAVACAGCLLVQILRTSTQVASWLGVGGSGRVWLAIGTLPCFVLLAYLAAHRLAEHVVARFDVVPTRPAIGGPHDS